MSDTPPRETAAERAEAAATRRRWVSIAELVAIAGVIIAALSLYTGWSDRRADEAERKADKQSEAKVRTLVRLQGTPQEGGDVLALADPQHAIQSADLTFPADLKIPAQSEVLKPEIEAKWLSDQILKLTDGGPDAVQGRMPVLIAASYWDADQQRTDTAIYDVVWKTEGRFLRGRTVKLEGLLLHERGGSPARLNTLWAKEKPVVPVKK